MLKDEIQPYLDLSNQVSYYKLPDPKPNAASGNGLLYTSEYLITLQKNSQLLPEDLVNFLFMIGHCEIAPGFYHRSPFTTDISSYDDYIGVAAASIQCARDIDSFSGSRVDPVSGTHIYLWRQPQVIAHIKMCANRTLMPWYALFWCLSLTYSSFMTAKSDQDGWMLSWILVSSAEQSKTSNMLIRAVCKLWRSRYEKVWKEDVQGICARTIEAGHPLGKYFKY